MKKHILTGFLAALVLTQSAMAVDIAEIEKKLTGDGVDGWVHGSVPGQMLYVFTYRNPEDFFDNIQMSLVPATAAIAKTLATLNRHDKVRVKGKFMKNPSPQKHIKVMQLEIIKAHASAYETKPYEYEAKIPDELLGLKQAKFLVHAIGAEGHILVVEYKDTVLPIFVKDAAATAKLFRNDVVELKIAIQKEPNHPTHLVLDEKAADSVRVIESIQSLHGQKATIEGALILFPKSPEIIFNVFAVQEKLSDGLSRQFTLVNFDNPETFKKIREKLQAAWNQYEKDYVNGRNKLISTRVRVSATGTLNEIDANQANPQILLESVDSIEIL